MNSVKEQKNRHQELLNDQLKIASIKNNVPIYGKRLDPDNILGKHFKILQLRRTYPDIAFDRTDNEIPVFGEIKIHKLDEIKRPPTPDLIKKIRKQREEFKKSLGK